MAGGGVNIVGVLSIARPRLPCGASADDLIFDFIFILSNSHDFASDVSPLFACILAFIYDGPKLTLPDIIQSGSKPLLKNYSDTYCKLFGHLQSLCHHLCASRGYNDVEIGSTGKIPWREALKACDALLLKSDALTCFDEHIDIGREAIRAVAS